MAGVGSVLSGIGSVLGGLSGFSSIFGDSQSDIALDTFYRQQSLMDRNNKFQSDENEKSRRFTQDMYQRQWNDISSYNDYKNVVQRAQDAGVSPSAIFGSGAPANLGGISPASVGHVASPSPDYSGTINPVNQSAQSFHSIASGLKALGELAKTGVETGHLGQLMSAQIKSELSRAGLQQVQADSQAYEFELRKIFGPGLYKSEIGERLARAHSLQMQAYLASEQGKTEDSKRLVMESEKELNEAKKYMTDSQRNLYDLNAEWYPKYAQADINQRNASAEESRASAYQKRQEGDQLAFFNELRQDPGVRRSLTEELMELGKQAQNKTLISDRQYRLLEKQIEQLGKATDNYEIQMWSNIINQTLGTAANAIGEVTRFSLAKKFLLSPKKETPPPMEYWPGTTTRGESW